MRYIKMFIGGMAFPSTIFPFLFLIAWTYGKAQVLTIPFLHFIPLLWGIWNILYFTFFLKILPGNPTLRLLTTGAVLGFFVVVYGVFGLDIPLLLGFPKSFFYLPLFVGPVVYAIFWLFIVNPINHLLEINQGKEK